MKLRSKIYNVLFFVFLIVFSSSAIAKPTNYQKYEQKIAKIKLELQKAKSDDLEQVSSSMEALDQLAFSIAEARPISLKAALLCNEIENLQMVYGVPLYSDKDAEKFRELVIAKSSKKSPEYYEVLAKKKMLPILTGIALERIAISKIEIAFEAMVAAEKASADKAFAFAYFDTLSIMINYAEGGPKKQKLDLKLANAKVRLGEFLIEQNYSDFLTHESRPGYRDIYLDRALARFQSDTSFFLSWILEGEKVAQNYYNALIDIKTHRLKIGIDAKNIDEYYNTIGLENFVKAYFERSAIKEKFTLSDSEARKLEYSDEELARTYPENYYKCPKNTDELRPSISKALGEEITDVSVVFLYDIIDGEAQNFRIVGRFDPLQNLRIPDELVKKLNETKGMKVTAPKIESCLKDRIIIATPTGGR